ncbi:hypothetical protein [Rhizobium sp. F40D2]
MIQGRPAGAGSDRVRLKFFRCVAAVALGGAAAMRKPLGVAAAWE